MTLGDIARGSWPREFERRKGVVFSYVMNNYTPEGYLAGQGGELTFRYVLTSGTKLDPARLSKVGWEAMSPLEVNEIRPNDKPVFVPRALNAYQASFLQVDQPNIVLVTWKLAEDEKGSILRFLETSGTATSVTVSSSLLKLDQAWLCNAVEDNQHRLPTTKHQFSFEVKPFGIVTVRLIASLMAELPGGSAVVAGDHREVQAPRAPSEAGVKRVGALPGHTGKGSERDRELDIIGPRADKASHRTLSASSY